MITHKIHDLSNKYVVNLLTTGLASVTQSPENYSPLYSEYNANLFYILAAGRYARGAYYVLEDDNGYVASSGWNEYDSDTALVLTRSYVSHAHRGTYVMGNLLLPGMIDECQHYKNTWMTCHGDNKIIYDWISRLHQDKTSKIHDVWPPIYSRFEPIGIKNIYHTDQYVMQLKR